MFCGPCVYVSLDGLMFDVVMTCFFFENKRSSIVNLAETRRAYDEEAGEIPVAFVVRKHGSEISQAALIDYVAKQVCHSFTQINYFTLL